MAIFQSLSVQANRLSRVGNPILLSRLFSLSSINSMAKVGDKLPNLELTEDNPGNKVNVLDVAKGKKIVIFGVPGAFTPGCSKTHLPGYVAKRDELKSKGIDEVVCVSVNDAFVMAAWGKDQNADGKVRMLADADASFTKALGVEAIILPLGGIRSKRFALVAENGIITQLNIEPDGTGLTCSLVEQLKL